MLIVGCGNMGGAMLKGWLAGGAAPADFTVIDPVLSEAPAGVRLVRDAGEIGPDEDFDTVLLSFKPQQLPAIAPGVGRFVRKGTRLLSVLAGVDDATLLRLFPEGEPIRVMPNLAAAIGKSPIILFSPRLDDGARGEITKLMQPLGTPEWLADEGQFDLVTALAGSGPAFVYRFIDALAAGAAELGLPREQADRLALAMVEGASALAAISEHAPGELARRVASPGGVTQVGIDILDKDQALARLLSDTLRGARDRSAEMTRNTQ